MTRSMLCRSMVLAALLWAPCWSGRAHAADVSSLTRQAEVVVMGRVSRVRCRWAESTPTILTLATVRVDRCLKGGLRPGGSVTVQAYGGEINGMRQNVPGAPHFQEGAYVLVFLNSMDGGLYWVPGGADGVVPLRGERRVTPDGKALDSLIRDVNLALGN